MRGKARFIVFGREGVHALSLIDEALQIRRERLLERPWSRRGCAGVDATTTWTCICPEGTCPGIFAQSVGYLSHNGNVCKAEGARIAEDSRGCHNNRHVNISFEITR